MSLIPIVPEVLAEMGEKEQAFWMELLEEAEAALKTAEEKGSGHPYIPSDSLKEKFKMAISRFEGEQYLLIPYLRKRFSF